MYNYEEIKDRILNNLNTDIDKREGSFTNDMISPISLELEKAYTNQQDLVDMAFVRNGFFNYLDLKCEEFGISRKNGTKAVGTVVFEGTDNTLISNGTVLYLDELYFVVLNDETITSGQAELIVEAYETGAEYNLLSNTELTLQDNIEGVTRVYVKEDINTGTDVESDEELRERFFDTIKKSYTSGNKAHYEKWVSEVEGVGRYIVYPLKNGNGTVGITITNANMGVADSTLITNVTEYVNGNKPIGASIEVISATENTINITANVDIATSTTIDTVKAEFIEKVKEYFKNISLDGVTSTVSIAKIGNLLFEITGVLDYNTLKLNTVTTNISLSQDVIPKIGTVTLMEV